MHPYPEYGGDPSSNLGRGVKNIFVGLKIKKKIFSAEVPYLFRIRKVSREKFF